MFRRMSEDYRKFVEKKSHLSSMDGFEPIDLPGFLFDFQAALTDWAIRKGRAAIFADCGLGKTAMQLVWSNNVLRKTNRSVLILAPLAVAAQIVREGEKFGIECQRSYGGRIDGPAKIIVSNYDRAERFDSADFAGFVCDESSILKNFDGAIKSTITEFAIKLPYRLLCTATAAPNNYIELGTSSEALGELGYMDMLSRFFKNEQNTNNPNRNWDDGGKWRFKGHAEKPFWRWVCSWARAIRKPSDLGFDDGRFVLPPLTEIDHVVKCSTPRDGYLFDVPAVGLKEEGEERRRSIADRCEKMAEVVTAHNRSLIWCHLNPEGKLLTKLIPDSVEVCGSDSDEKKEESLLAFANGDVKRLITKPKIGAFGMNFQTCAHVATFASHSFEQRYQGIRRCWRFGQTRPVVVDTISTEGEAGIVANLRRKAQAAEAMFAGLVEMMNDAMKVSGFRVHSKEMEIPSWLS